MEIKDMIENLHTMVEITPEFRMEVAKKLGQLSELLQINNKDIEKVAQERDSLQKKLLEIAHVPSERAAILREAEKMVCGHREQDYGDPEDNFLLIAQLWTAYTGREHSPLDVAIMMCLMKIGRIATGTATRDSFVDAIGYLACGAEIRERM